MKTAFAVFLAAATPALADESALIAFMGGQGCTFGEESRAAAMAAGHDASDIDALIKAALADGRAKEERAYTVLNAATCTIRLPEISSKYTVNTPEIVAITSAIDQYVGVEGLIDFHGCFLPEAYAVFDTLNGGEPGAGFNDYMAFSAAGFISGDLRFYAPSPLVTPPSMQVVTGACADVPNIDAIRRSHEALTRGFGDYIRLVGAETDCDNGWSPSSMSFLAELQGYDPNGPEEGQPEINAWLFVEYDLIAKAAGWYEGMTSTAKGTPRPPLCHYPPEG